MQIFCHFFLTNVQILRYLLKIKDMENSEKQIKAMQNAINAYCNNENITLEEYGLRLGYKRTAWTHRRKVGTYTMADLVQMANDMNISLDNLLNRKKP